MLSIIHTQGDQARQGSQPTVPPGCGEQGGLGAGCGARTSTLGLSATRPHRTLRPSAGDESRGHRGSREPAPGPLVHITDEIPRWRTDSGHFPSSPRPLTAPLTVPACMLAAPVGPRRSARTGAAATPESPNRAALPAVAARGRADPGRSRRGTLPRGRGCGRSRTAADPDRPRCRPGPAMARDPAFVLRYLAEVEELAEDVLASRQQVRPSSGGPPPPRCVPPLAAPSPGRSRLSRSPCRSWTWT